MTAPDRACVFCDIVDGTVPSHTVWEDDQTKAFLDINPAAPGHTLVVPKTHAPDLFDLDPDTAAAVMRTAKTVADLLEERLSPDGLTLVQTNRSAGWQDVFHLHMHLVPRWHDDTLTRPWVPQPARTGDLDEVAHQLRSRPTR